MHLSSEGSELSIFNSWDNPVTSRNCNEQTRKKQEMSVSSTNPSITNTFHTGTSHILRNISISKMHHRVIIQNRYSGMYQGRCQYTYSLCHKNHAKFHCHGITWFILTWNKVFSDTERISLSKGSFNTALCFWISVPYIPCSGSCKTHL